MLSSVSIVIPTYKSGAFIFNTIERVYTEAAKHFFNVEIIVVDDGSKSAKIKSELKRAAKSLGIVLNYIELEENIGQFICTNIGLQFATKHNIITLDDDLKYNPELFNRFIEIAEKDNIKDIVYGVAKGSLLYRFFRGAINFYAGKPVTSSFRFFPKQILGDKFINIPIDAYLTNNRAGYDIHYFYIENLPGLVLKNTRTKLISRMQMFMHYSPMYKYNKIWVVMVLAIAAIIWQYNNVFVVVPAALIVLLFGYMLLRYNFFKADYSAIKYKQAVIT